MLLHNFGAILKHHFHIEMYTQIKKKYILKCILATTYTAGTETANFKYGIFLFVCVCVHLLYV
jgi:hypothetical protein